MVGNGGMYRESQKTLYRDVYEIPSRHLPPLHTNTSRGVYVYEIRLAAVKRIFVDKIVDAPPL
jgi:hypothetical protein